MRKFVCTVCGYVYDESAGAPDSGISPGTKWEDLPENWTCPLCGASKAEFRAETAAQKPEAKKPGAQPEHQEELRELSYGEMSALFSNLSKGCEKQYRAEEAALFGTLAAYYEARSGPAAGDRFEEVKVLLETDLSALYQQAGAAAAAESDRGALRALVWGEKVSKIISSILSRYEKQGSALLENTKIYVCEICGFVYIGDAPPEICPVCKVPNFKIRQIQRGAA